LGTSISAQPAGDRRKRFPTWLIPVIGYSISIASMIWVYRGFDWKGELPRLFATDIKMVLLAIVADILVYVCQGFRWSRLLSPLTDISPWKTTQAIYIGLFANEVLPLRSGEVIRCYLQARWAGLKLPIVISSAIIERMIDGFWLVIGFWIISHFVALPGFLVVGSRILTGVLVLVAGLVLLAVLHHPHAHRAVNSSRWADSLSGLVDGVHAMGRSRSFVETILLSLLYLLLQILPVLFLMIGYDLDLKWTSAAVVLVILRLGTIIPQAPSNVGSFQALTILGLRLFGMDRGDATGYATLLFLVVTVPLWIAGFVALLATRMRLGEIHRDAHQTFAQSRSAEKPLS
jgi:uncharacterized protein (TIRG00374 family)